MPPANAQIQRCVTLGPSSSRGEGPPAPVSVSVPMHSWVGRYKPKALRRLDGFYVKAQEEMRVDAQIKKVAAPIPLSLYERVSGYLARHHDEPGHPQTIKEFLTLSLARVLDDVELEERAEKPQNQVA